MLDTGVVIESGVFSDGELVKSFTSANKQSAVALILQELTQIGDQFSALTQRF